MSRKGKREERLLRGDELLERRGIDLDAPDDELLPRLIGAIGSDPDADLSVADYLGSIALDGAASRLAEWEKAAPTDKDLLRVIRRSLFRLEQRGVAAATAAREKAPAEPVRLFEPIEPKGYLSPLDGAGNRLAWIARPRAEGGLLVMTSVLSDSLGMRDLGLMSVKKARLKEIFADAARHAAPLAGAPHRYVDWLMSQAYRRGAPRDESGGGYSLMRAEFYPSPATPVASPLPDMLPSPAAGELERLLDESARLFDEPEFAGWALPEELVKVHQARFSDAQGSTIVLSKEAMADRLTGIIDQALEELFSGEPRALYAERMAEMALWYLLAGAEGGSPDRTGAARWCHAVHLALADPAGRLQRVSFVRALVFRSFLHLMPRDEEAARKRDDPASLIVRPD